jgi:hypothetical protein
MRLFRGRSRERKQTTPDTHYPRASSANPCSLGVSIGRQIVELPQERHSSRQINGDAACSSRMRVILPEEKESSPRTRKTPAVSPSKATIIGETLKSPLPIKTREERSSTPFSNDSERLQESRSSWTVTSV